MEFDETYKKLMEAYFADAQTSHDFNRVARGQTTEDNFERYAKQKGLLVLKATPIEDRTERWDFKLYSTESGKKLPAFYSHKLNQMQEPPIPKLKGTVDVKSKGLSGEYYLMHIVSKGRGDGWTRGVNWMAIPEGETFRMIHCPSLLRVLKTYGKIDILNPDAPNTTVVSTDPNRSLQYSTTISELSIDKGILYGDGQSSIGVLVKNNTLIMLSFLL